MSRVASHARVLGILWLFFSCYPLLGGILSRIFSQRPPATALVPHAVPTLTMRIFVWLSLLGALFGAAAGVGLLTRQPWARMLALVLAFVSLLGVPFAIAVPVYTLVGVLAIYTLAILLPPGSAEQWHDFVVIK